MVDSVEQKSTDQEQLDRIKENIERSYKYNEDNAKRWHEFQEFVFLTSISEDDRATLDDLGKPQIEFNILEAYVSRLCGEFSKQQPSIEANVTGGDQVNPQTLDFVEGYFRSMEYESRHNGTANRLYKDQLSGGFSVAKVWTEYENDQSFTQTIKWDRAFDPTLCGFDPMANLPHKGDGRYTFECFPKTRKYVEKEYNIDLSTLGYTKNVDGFSWSYRTNKEDIVLLCHYYEKEEERVKIHKLSTGQTITDKMYRKMIPRWESSPDMEQTPQITATRWSTMQTIARYTVIENKILKRKETDFAFLPQVFFDGNSVLLRKTEDGDIQQYTRPYIYQAKGAQRLKNFAGQTLANELENLVQHKFIVPLEGIPAAFAEAYKDVQKASTLVYNQFMDNDPNVRLDPPHAVVRPPIPQEIAGAFAGADSVVQGVLGSYDAALGINNNQLSGVAIVEGATQSNAAAMPYVINYLAGLSQIAKIVVDLIPKYLVTPTTVPIIGKDGKRRFEPVNQPGQPPLKYNSQSLNIKVEAGVNFEIQKDKNMKMLAQTAQAFPAFGEFINEKGLPIIIDNIDIKGKSQLKELAEEYTQAKAKQPPRPDPAMMNAQTKRMELEQKGQQNEQDNKAKAVDLAIKQDQVDNGHTEALIKAHDSNVGRELAQEEVDAENSRTAADIMLKSVNMGHEHGKNIAEHAQKFSDNNTGE